MQPQWWTQFEQARHAGVAGIALEFNTTDYICHPESGIKPCRPVPYLTAQLSRQGYVVVEFSLANGLAELRPPGEEKRAGAGVFDRIVGQRDPAVVFPYLAGILRSVTPKVAILFDHAEHLAPDAPMGVLDGTSAEVLEHLHAWSTTDDAVKATENLVVLITYQNSLHSLLRNGGYRRVRVDLPNTEERLTFLNLLDTARRQGRARDFAALAADLTVEQTAQLTAGLRYADIEELLRQAAAEGELVCQARIADRKKQAIHAMAEGTVEVVEPDVDPDEVVGCTHVVEYIDNVVWQLRAGSRGVPPALLLAGPPGSGKGHFVKVIAAKLGWPLLALRNFRDRWVGSTEANLERLLALVEALWPVVIWIDELDQAIGQRNTGPSADGGTSERVMARLWEFMGSVEHRGQLLWVATTNRPDVLDPATLDRFPVVLPILHPSESEVVALLPSLAQRLGRSFAPDADFAACASLPALRLPTVRQLQEVVARAGMLADQDIGTAGAAIDLAHFDEAAQDYSPTYDLLQHEYIALQSVRLAPFESLLPWRTRHGRRAEVAAPEYLQPMVDGDGRLDRGRLNARLRELERELGVR